VAESRTLDDLEEILPDIAFWGGVLYATWWLGQRITPWVDPNLYVAPINRFTGQFQDSWDYVSGFWEEDGFIDDWTYNPQEFRSDAGRLLTGVTSVPGRIWNATFGRLLG